MPVFQLDERLLFPDPELAEPDGLLAVGGDLSPERLLLAYASGIFPWPVDDLPLLWHSPHPRLVLAADALHVSRSLSKVLRRGRFRCTLDTDFPAVIEACATVPRPGQGGTWITEEMVAAYCEIHRLGFGHSFEVWLDDELVGGGYGLSLGAAFFGESMFSRETNASKVGFVHLVRQLRRWAMPLIDAQVHTPLLESFGAVPWPRPRYLAALAAALGSPTRRGPWKFDD